MGLRLDGEATAQRRQDCANSHVILFFHFPTPPPRPESPFQFLKKQNDRNFENIFLYGHVLCGLVVRKINKHEF
jgi:hypothetical protein